MAIKFECGSCGKTITAPDKAAGRRGKCPHCGQVVVVGDAVGGTGGTRRPAQPPAAGAKTGKSPATPTGRRKSTPAPSTAKRSATGPPAAKPPGPPPVPAQRPAARPQVPPPIPVEPGRPPPPPVPPPIPEQAPGLGATAKKIGSPISSIKETAGCFGPRLFAGEPYIGQHYYIAGAGQKQKDVLGRIQEALSRRGPKDLIIKVSQGKPTGGGAPRDIISARWSIGYGYVVCLAPGSDLFVSVRVNFAPGCLARILNLAPWQKLEPNIFGVDDLNMLGHCLATTVEEQLEALQLEYIADVNA